MTHFVNDRCVRCKYTKCVVLCPVDCFCEGEKTLVIDPEVCIDCGVCVDDCPVQAIVNDDTVIDGKKFHEIQEAAQNDVPLTEDQQNSLAMYQFNEFYSKRWPVINIEKDPMPEAEEFKDNLNKLSYISDELNLMKNS